MLKIGGELDLLEEALGAEDGRELGVEHLDSDLAMVLQILGEIHGRHAAGAEFALDAIAIGQRWGQSSNGVAHCFNFALRSANQLSTSTRRTAFVVDRPGWSRNANRPSGITANA